MRLLALLLAGFAASGCGGSDPGSPSVVVFAAASLRDVASEVAAAFERRHPTKVELNFAGSNTLAQQIDAAPEADVFLSADRQWVDFLESEGRTLPSTLRPVLSNRLVVIARRDSEIRIDRPEDLDRDDYRHLALGDPAGVPAGRYARSYLERIDQGGRSLWEGLADRVVPAVDARAALALVESDPEILGIVYRTDALASSRVRQLYAFPVESDLPITYWAVLVASGGSPDLGRRFLDFWSDSQAREIAERLGFTWPEG